LPMAAAARDPFRRRTRGPRVRSLADPDRVWRILTDAGFTKIAIDAHADVSIGGRARRCGRRIPVQMGPTGSALRQGPCCRAAGARCRRSHRSVPRRRRREDGFATWFVLALSLIDSAGVQPSWLEPAWRSGRAKPAHADHQRDEADSRASSAVPA
jgi:hypothetical protein